MHTAQCAYDAMQGKDPERLVSGSDDFTLFLWNPAESKKHIARMTGELVLYIVQHFCGD